MAKTDKATGDIPDMETIRDALAGNGGIQALEGISYNPYRAQPFMSAEEAESTDFVAAQGTVPVRTAQMASGGGAAAPAGPSGRGSTSGSTAGGAATTGTP